MYNTHSKTYILLTKKHLPLTLFSTRLYYTIKINPIPLDAFICNTKNILEKKPDTPIISDIKHSNEFLFRLVGIRDVKIFTPRKASMFLPHLKAHDIVYCLYTPFPAKEMEEIHRYPLEKIYNLYLKNKILPIVIKIAEAYDVNKF